ncbi:MAG: hypothetical protein JWN32_3925 [Solirubrobacterales bacterium]|nr:hypothetical protein [Solirubrobacterales bacterium]
MRVWLVLIGLTLAAPAIARAGPLDVASATLGQQGTELQLRVRTREGWRPGQLSVSGPHALCLVLSYGVPRRPRSEVCVGGDGGRPVLRRIGLDPSGRAVGGEEAVTADVSRDDERSLAASFSPLDVRLPLGRFAWRVQTSSDRFPEAGDVSARAVVLAEPACFGAAARDAAHPCSNPKLRRSVTPTPSEALVTPNAPCTRLARVGLVGPCAFGAAPAEARATVALVGDSHAEHWRGAIDVVAQARHWRGLSITRASCPFSESHARLVTPALSASCARWNAATRRWFRRHPEVHTVIVSEHSATTFEGDAVSGYRAAWHALPSTVRRIVVLRDTPRIVAPQAACVARLMRAHQAIGFHCAQPRALDLPSDPAAIAARGAGDRRVRLVDLTRYMCSPRLCPAVIGGVLVRKDGTHLTRLFATTLGPFVLRALGG